MAGLANSQRVSDITINISFYYLISANKIIYELHISSSVSRIIVAHLIFSLLLGDELS